MLLAPLTTSLLALGAPAPVEIAPEPSWTRFADLPLAEADEAAPALVPGQSAPGQKVTRSRWRDGQHVLQGFLGVTFYDDFKVENDGISIDGGGDSASQMPLIGGGGQLKLGGGRVDFGIEGMFSMAWRSNATAFAVSSGGAAVAVDIDTFLIDLYGGPFASMFIGDRTRLYAGVGPMLEWADYDQETELFSDSGSGFGVGWYARGGIEFALASRTMVGFGMRWSDSTIDLDGGVGDLEIQGVQAFITVTEGF